MNRKRLGTPFMRWLVILVVGSMIVGILLWPIAVALGAESGTTPAPTDPAASPADPSSAPTANPHAGVPGAPGGPTDGTAASTSLPNQVGIEVTHLVFSLKEGALGVFQMTQVVNGTDKPSGPLVFTLPAGAANFQLMGGVADGKLEKTATGFTDKEGLKAGEAKQVTYRFEIPAQGQALTLSLPFPMAAAAVYILTDPSGMTMPGTLNTAFEDAGGMQIKDRVYRQFVHGPVAAGEELTLNLQLVPDEEALAEAEAAASQPAAAPQAPASASGSQGTVTVVSLLLAMVAMAAAFAWRANRRRRLAPLAEDETFAVDAGELRQRKTELIQEIADLDRRAAAGQIPKQEHGQRRAARMKDLLAVMADLQRLE